MACIMLLKMFLKIVLLYPQAVTSRGTVEVWQKNIARCIGPRPCHCAGFLVIATTFQFADS
jgi:hypothetical protein